MNHTVEEVREWAIIAQAQAKLYASMKGAHEPWEKLGAILTAYADMIEASEESAVGYVATDNKIVFYVEDGWSKEVPPGTELFTRQPAQAAQVDQVGELLAIIHGDGGHYQAEHGLQKAAKDAQEKVIQMMTKIAMLAASQPG